jgi:hypothetical protein
VSASGPSPCRPGYRANVTFTGSFGQPAIPSVSAWRSASSTVSCHRIFTATQSARYAHRYASAGGSHVAGSWSALDRLERAATAIRARSSPRSFAYASRSFADHIPAPESQASASGTM